MISTLPEPAHGGTRAVTLCGCSQGCYSRLAGSISPARRDLFHSPKIKRDSARSAITITQLFQKERSRDKPKSLLLQQHSGVLWLREKRIIRTERLFAISNHVLQVKQSHDRDSVTVCYLYFWDYTPFIKP